MLSDEQYMRLALEQAKQAFREQEVPIGAIIVDNQGNIISQAHNRVQQHRSATAHAELLAISKACESLNIKYLTDCTLYVTIEPCIMCAGAIGWAQLRRIVYGASEIKRGYKLFAPLALHPKCEAIGGILESECKELIQTFFKTKR